MVDSECHNSIQPVKDSVLAIFNDPFERPLPDSAHSGTASDKNGHKNK